MGIRFRKIIKKNSNASSLQLVNSKLKTIRLENSWLSMLPQMYLEIQTQVLHSL